MIIGIIGRKGSGKSTLASYLQHNMQDSKVVPLAKPIKEYIDGFFKEMGLDSVISKEERRPAYMLLGDIVRGYNIDGYINYLKSKTDQSKDVIIVDDIRYTNEFMMCDIVIDAEKVNPDLAVEKNPKDLSEQLTTMIKQELVKPLDLGFIKVDGCYIREDYDRQYCIIDNILRRYNGSQWSIGDNRN